MEAEYEWKIHKQDILRSESLVHAIENRRVRGRA